MDKRMLVDNGTIVCSGYIRCRIILRHTATKESLKVSHYINTYTMICIQFLGKHIPSFLLPYADVFNKIPAFLEIPL